MSEGKKKKKKHFNGKLVPEEKLDCPECTAPMQRRPSKFGLFYGCTRFPECRGTHGCHPDGKPLGTPANKETKLARIAAHDALGRYAKSKKWNRNKEYAFLRQVMNLPGKECHIGLFSKETCEILIERIREIELDELSKQNF